MTTTDRRPGPESTLEDVRDLLVEAAVSDLRTRGIEIGLSHIKLSDAIVAAGVTRSTAYRSLADDTLSPQEVLRREVLRHVLSRDARDANLAVVQAAVASELERQQANLDSDHIGQRTAALRSVIRVGTEASYRTITSSTERSILSASYGALQSSGVTDWRLEALADGEAKVSELFGSLYTDICERFRYRLRAGLELVQFGTAAAAAIEGVAMRHGLNDHLEDIQRATGPHGEIESWTLYGIMFEALFTVFFEPSEPDAPFADLRAH